MSPRLQNAVARAGHKIPKETKRKMHNQPTEVDGVIYDSKKEAIRKCELALLERTGEISELKEQVPFLLIPTQRTNSPEKKTEYPVKYVADFVYRDSAGNLVVEDTKGHKTKEYIIKRKLMLFVHGIIVREK